MGPFCQALMVASLGLLFAYRSICTPASLGVFHAGFGATISAPHMHAHCLEILRGKLHPGAQVRMRVLLLLLLLLLFLLCGSTMLHMEKSNSSGSEELGLHPCRSLQLQSSSASCSAPPDMMDKGLCKLGCAMLLYCIPNIHCMVPLQAPNRIAWE